MKPSWPTSFLAISLHLLCTRICTICLPISTRTMHASRGNLGLAVQSCQTTESKFDTSSCSFALPSPRYMPGRHALPKQIIFLFLPVCIHLGIFSCTYTSRLSVYGNQQEFEAIRDCTHAFDARLIDFAFLPLILLPFYSFSFTSAAPELWLFNPN